MTNAKVDVYVVAEYVPDHAFAGQNPVKVGGVYRDYGQARSSCGLGQQVFGPFELDLDNRDTNLDTKCKPIGFFASIFG